MTKPKSYHNPDNLPFLPYRCHLERIEPINIKPTEAQEQELRTMLKEWQNAPKDFAAIENAEPQWIMLDNPAPCPECERTGK